MEKYTINDKPVSQLDFHKSLVNNCYAELSGIHNLNDLCTLLTRDVSDKYNKMLGGDYVITNNDKFMIVVC